MKKKTYEELVCEYQVTSKSKAGIFSRSDDAMFYFPADQEQTAGNDIQN